MNFKNWQDLEEAVKTVSPRRIVVAGAEEVTILQALAETAAMGLVEPVLVGNPERIKNCCRDYNIPDWEIMKCTDEEIASTAVAIVREDQEALLMKGRIQTAELVKAALNRDAGIRGGQGQRFSHVMAVETPGYHKMLYISDGGINLHPDAGTLKAIATNAIHMVRTLGVDKPKTAMITLVEKVNPKITSTIRAAEVVKHFRGKEIVEGPISIDIALSREAAEMKGYTSEISGDTDILVMPHATASNVAIKVLRLVGGGRIGGVVMGARRPILMVSRSDDAASKRRSIFLGLIYQERRQQQC